MIPQGLMEQLSKTPDNPNLQLISEFVINMIPLDDLKGQNYFDFMVEHLNGVPIPKRSLATRQNKNG